MKLLLTGAHGFIGENIIGILSEQYDVICTLGISKENDIICDLSKGIPELAESCDVVLHMAGLAHDDRDISLDRYMEVNVTGVKNLCKSLERCGLPSSFVFISSCAVYGHPFGEGITEDHPLNGTSSYGKSKIQAEHFLTGWCREHGIVLTILRPSLIVGKGAKGTLASMEKAIRCGYYFNVAGGIARKSLLMVEDIAGVLPLVVNRGGIYNLCDTDPLSYYEISEAISRCYEKRVPRSIPFKLASLLSGIGDIVGLIWPIDKRVLEKLTSTATFSNEKARRELGWEPTPVLENFVL